MIRLPGLRAPLNTGHFRNGVDLVLGRRVAPVEPATIQSADVFEATAPAVPLPVARPLPWIPGRPAMDAGGLEAFTRLLSAAKVFLEYGAGGSTVLAAQANVPAVVSVESDADWAAGVRAKIKDREGYTILHANIGDTIQFGYPATADRWFNYAGYPLRAWDFCKAEGLAPDLVLVDGRFRRACFYASVLHAPPGCRIVFDDYGDRPYYRSVERHLQPVAMHGRLAEFVVPEVRDVHALWRAFVDCSIDTA